MHVKARMLQAALAAMASLEAVKAIATSSADKLKYPSFSAKMDACYGHQWKAYPVTTATGYNLTLFRIIGDEAQVAYAGAKGPILLLEGLYSDAQDWITCAEEENDSIAVQLAERGHDVWIGQTRGREYSTSHKTLILPDQDKEFWNYSFDNIGREDIPALVDTVIANRFGPTNCNKVTLVTHSSGLSASLVGAIKVPGFSEKVGQINGLAPCIALNLEKFVLPQARDLTSIQAFYNILDMAGMTHLFGPSYAEDVQKLCNFPIYGPIMCDNFFHPSLVSPALKQQSTKAYRHIH